MITPDFDARLLELAREQQRVESENARLREQLELAYRRYVKPLEDQIAANAARLEQMEDALRADTLRFVAETGNTTPHPSLTFRRTTRLCYDREATLRAAEDHGALNLVRVKRELNVREFESAWRRGLAAWAEVEEVPAPTVAVGKLGDLLIQAEVDGAGE